MCPVNMEAFPFLQMGPQLGLGQVSINLFLMNAVSKLYYCFFRVWVGQVRDLLERSLFLPPKQFSAVLNITFVIRHTENLFQVSAEKKTLFSAGQDFRFHHRRLVLQLGRIEIGLDVVFVVFVLVQTKELIGEYLSACDANWVNWSPDHYLLARICQLR